MRQVPCGSKVWKTCSPMGTGHTQLQDSHLESKSSRRKWLHWGCHKTRQRLRVLGTAPPWRAVVLVVTPVMGSIMAPLHCVLGTSLSFIILHHTALHISANFGGDKRQIKSISHHHNFSSILRRNSEVTFPALQPSLWGDSQKSQTCSLILDCIKNRINLKIHLIKSCI